MWLYLAQLREEFEAYRRASDESLKAMADELGTAKQDLAKTHEELALSRRNSESGIQAKAEELEATKKELAKVYRLCEFMWLSSWLIPSYIVGQSAAP